MRGSPASQRGRGGRNPEPTPRPAAPQPETRAASDRLPILADAIQDAGCDNADVFDHCRGEGPHVRGCWAVDAVRGVHWQPGARTRGR